MIKLLSIFVIIVILAVLIKFGKELANIIEEVESNNDYIDINDIHK